MKFARLIVLGIAVGAGGIAAYLAGSSRPPPPVKAEAPASKIATVDILVAKTNLGIGRALRAGDIKWQAWPAKYASPQFIRRENHRAALQQLLGYVVRVPFVAGEPIREAKLINANGAGYMAAILPPGMRAISVEITPESGAGGFILPNDRVDLILTSADKDGTGKEYYRSRTILKDVRVLAIDQSVDDRDGRKTAIGKIATLELSPQDAEKLSLARRLGSISLTLRGLTKDAQNKRSDAASLARQEDVTIVRFGRASAQ